MLGQVLSEALPSSLPRKSASAHTASSGRWTAPGAFVKAQYFGSCSHTFLRTQHSAHTLGENGLLLPHLQRQKKSKHLLLIMKVFCTCAPDIPCLFLLEKDENLPQMLSSSRMSLFKFYFFNYLLLFSVLKTCQQRPTKSKMWAPGFKITSRQTAASCTQLPLPLLSIASFLLVFDTVQNTNNYNWGCGEAEWFLVFTGRLSAWK